MPKITYPNKSQCVDLANPQPYEVFTPTDANMVKEVVNTIDNLILLGQSGSFAGSAVPTTNPGTPANKIFYVATQAGTYTNFGGAVVSAGSFAVLAWTGSAWVLSQTVVNGLDQVNNTSDLNKPVSTAQAAAIANKANLTLNSFYNKDYALFPDGFIYNPGDLYGYTGEYSPAVVDTKTNFSSYAIPIESNTVIYAEGIFGYFCGVVEYDANMNKLPANWGTGSYHPYATDNGQQKRYFKFTSQATAKFLRITLKFADVPGNFRTTAQVVKYNSLSAANKAIADSNLAGNVFQPIGTVSTERQIPDSEIGAGIARVADVNAGFATTNANVLANTNSINGLSLLHKGDPKKTILDGNTWGWYDASDIKSITKDGSNKVSEWKDVSGNSRHLAQATLAKQPLYDNGTILTDGVDDFMKIVSPLALPVTIYAVIEEQKSFSPDGEYIWDGGTNNYMALVKNSFTTIRLFKGVYLDSAFRPTSACLVTARYDGANSHLSINQATDVVGNGGSFGGDPNGFVIGSAGDGNAVFSTVRFSEIIIRNKVDTAEDRKIIEDYLIKKWRKEFDVWVLAGQSNAAGFEGKLATTTDAAYKAIQENLIFNIVNNQWEKYNPAVNSAAGAAYFGPENSFLKDLADKTGKKTRMIKFAVGNTPLAKNDIKVDWNAETTGEHYDTLKTVISNAVNWYKPLIAIPKLKGFIWMQGETDASDNVSWANAYFRNLINLTGGVLDHCNSINKTNGVEGKLEVVIGKIRVVGTWSQTVRDAQAKYCAMRNAHLIDTDEYVLYPDNPSVHYDADSLILFGKDIVKSII